MTYDEPTVGGLEPVAIAQKPELSTGRQSAALALELDEVAKQNELIETLRSQEELTQQQVHPNSLLYHLQALNQVGTYSYQALGHARMLLLPNGTEQIESRHFYDSILIGDASETETARYLINHFEYVSRWSINWKWRKLQQSWDQKKSILDNMQSELSKSYEQWRDERVAYKETAPELNVVDTESYKLKKLRDDKIYIEYAHQVREIITTMITEIQTTLPPA